MSQTALNPQDDATMLADSSMAPNLFVTLNSTNDRHVATSDGSLPVLGSNIDTYSGGQNATIYRGGDVPIDYGADLAAGDVVKSNSVGKAVPITGIGIEFVAGICIQTRVSGQTGNVRLAPSKNIGTLKVKAKTADYAIVPATDLSGTPFSNLGAGGTITISLPAAPAEGTCYTFTRVAAQLLRVDPGASDGIYSGGALKADGKYIELAAIGDCVTLEADSAGNWVTISQFGTLTYE